MVRGKDELKPLLEHKPKLMLDDRFVIYNLVYEFTDACAHKAVTTVLAIFFLEGLHFSENAAAQLVHLYIYGSYGSCIIGSLVSHGFLGVYKSTYLFALMQIGGYMLLMLTTLPEFSSCSLIVFVALLIASIGFGANRTCFITYGCEQVMESVERKTRRAGGVLRYGGRSGDKGLDLITSEKRIASQQYLATIMMGTQAGYIFSTFISPIIRVHGAGSYFFVFLLPLCAKTVGTLAFWFGRDDLDLEGLRSRKQGHKSDEQEQTGSLQESGGQHSKLIDKGFIKAEDSPNRTWEDWKGLFSALLVMLPLVIIAALGSQTASTWIFQARRMNGNVPWLGNWTVPPDQMPVIGQGLTILFIPLFEMVVYPFVDKYIVKLTSLRKLVFSLILASTAFLVSGFLEIVIDCQLQKTGAEQADISIFWQAPPFALMAASEAFFLVSCSHFAYHEAPESMKSAVAGFLHSTLAFGNIITIAVIGVLGPDATKSEECFVFAAIGALAALIMAGLSYYYVPRVTRESRKQNVSDTP
ncbi:hypothetical protein Mapa_017635 [Marchantia paleacea]|nr:hypothetical protein Mapa_017635 [Marchantia paleacea]